MFAYYLIVKHDKALLQLTEILRRCQMMIESHVFTQNLHTKALKTTSCTSPSFLINFPLEPLVTYSETITASPCPSGMIA